MAKTSLTTWVAIGGLAVIGVTIANYNNRVTEPRAPTPASAPSAPAPAATPPRSTSIDPAQAKAATEMMDGLVKGGLVKRMVIAQGKFYVDGPLWRAFELDEKQKIVRAVSRAREVSTGLPQVTIYDSKTGKELASFGVFSGVTIEAER